MDRGALRRARRETRQSVKSTSNPTRANVRTKTLSRKAKKKHERSHGDQRIQRKCPQEFETFSEETKDLADKFDEFMRAIRPIGSSSGLIRVAEELQKSMRDVRGAFGSNSAEMWKFYSRTESDELPDKLRDFPRDPPVPVVSQLPKTMDDLSDHLDAFLKGLGEIPEFSDKRLTGALREFQDWLDYRVEYLDSRRGALGERSAAARRCIGRIMGEMSGHIRAVKAALKAFKEEGVKAIQDYQKKSQTKLQNMSTVATFFSAVTATTMQYTMEQEYLGTIVMGLWISSLILSIASAINSQLAMHWRAAMYRSPRSALPIWASVCLDHTPLLCLVGAVLAFSAGLVVWTFAANLALAVKICAATMTSATSLILFTVIIWDVREWWQGARKAQPTPSETEPPPGMPARRKPRKSAEQAAGDALNRVSDPLADGKGVWRQRLRDFMTGSASIAPPTLSHDGESPNRQDDVESGLMTQSPTRISFGGHNFPSGKSLASGSEEGGIETMVSDSALISVAAPGTTTSGHGILNKRRDAPPPSTGKVPPAHVAFQGAGYDSTENDAARTSIQASWSENSHPRRSQLLGLTPARVLDIDHPPGHDIHFSPDGMRLAISTRTGLTILEVSKAVVEPHDHPSSSEFERFVWSPDSSHIVAINVDTGLLTWNKDSVLGLAYAVGRFTKMGLHRLPLFVYDIANVPHQQGKNPGYETIPGYKTNHGLVVMLGVVLDDPPEQIPGSKFTRIKAKRPSSALQEHWLMVINADTNAFVAETSILAAARHICVSRDGKFALVSYDNGYCPELWQLRDDQGNFGLELWRDYAPPDPSSSGGATEHGISGKAHFCGESDEWVMATNGQSDIFIWDRDMGHLQHVLKGTEIRSKGSKYDGSITFITSKMINDSNKSMISVVSTGRNGGVVIWECSD
ncbi:hypothetical protein M407DRAFT_227814 [Tulasnella calospora MUT 4182]|uniref:Uncharacterized protein n=1 Tax=Tulasnella calospora MUT 4182 TaxID=1051891 RepID=A0A0C3L7X5_9AGAM|nr:hypothetical protein M407DRAFT_227814 [Tulasnella calospora MUT 4182]